MLDTSRNAHGECGKSGEAGAAVKRQSSVKERVGWMGGLRQRSALNSSARAPAHLCAYVGVKRLRAWRRRRAPASYVPCDRVRAAAKTPGPARVNLNVVELTATSISGRDKKHPKQKRGSRFSRARQHRPMMALRRRAPPSPKRLGVELAHHYGNAHERARRPRAPPPHPLVVARVVCERAALQAAVLILWP